MQENIIVTKFNSIIDKVRGTLFSYPLTILYISILTIFNIIFIIKEDFEYKLEFPVAIGILSAFLLEQLYEYKLLKNKVLYAIPILCSVISGIIVYKVKEDYSYMGVMGFAIAIFALIFYVLYYDRENKLVFSKLIETNFLLSVFTGIANSGFLVCILALHFLIFKFKDVWKPLGVISVLIGLFCFSILFITFIPKRTTEIKISKAYRVIIHKVLFYIYLLLIGILYLYIIKTIILWKMPVGKFNWFGCFALLFYVLFYLSVDEEDGIIQKFFKKYGALLMIPVLIMQLIGVYIRISSYGLTSARYMALVLVLVAIVFMIYSFTKLPIKYVFIPVAIISLLFTCTPLNFIDVPNRNQEDIMRKALINSEAFIVTGSYGNKTGELDEEATLKKEDLIKINSAYNYLAHASGTESKLYKQVSESKLKSQIVNNPDMDYTDEYGYDADIKEVYFFYEPDTGIDIKNYATMRKIEGTSETVEGENLTDFLLGLSNEEKEIMYITENKIIVFNTLSYQYNYTEGYFEFIDWECFVFDKY